MQPGQLDRAFEGVQVAYYLIHSLDTGAGFEETEARSARAFAEAASKAGVRRIVYLGGLAPDGVPVGELSQHLRSRVRVGEILRASGVPTVELRAAVIIGSGSASFEMLRYPTERLPVMITPKWVRIRVQPIAVRDVLRYGAVTSHADGSASTAASSIRTARTRTRGRTSASPPKPQPRSSSRRAPPPTRRSRYWTTEDLADDPGGFLALAPLAMAVLGRSVGLSFDVQSDYAPTDLLAGSRPAAGRPGASTDLSG